MITRLHATCTILLLGPKYIFFTAHVSALRIYSCARTEKAYTMLGLHRYTEKNGNTDTQKNTGTLPPIPVRTGTVVSFR